MLNITVTTSAGRFVFSVASPIHDSIDLIYKDCEYCGDPIKPTLIYQPSKTCRPAHRWAKWALKHDHSLPVHSPLLTSQR